MRVPPLFSYEKTTIIYKNASNCREKSSCHHRSTEFCVKNIFLNPQYTPKPAHPYTHIYLRPHTLLHLRYPQPSLHRSHIPPKPCLSSKSPIHPTHHLYPMAEFCVQLMVTFPCARPPSLVEFHSIDNNANITLRIKSQYCHNVTVFHLVFIGII